MYFVSGNGENKMQNWMMLLVLGYKNPESTFLRLLNLQIVVQRHSGYALSLSPLSL